MRFIAFNQADESYANFKTSSSHRLTSKNSITFSWLVIYLILQIYGLATLIAYVAHYSSPMKVCREISFVFILNKQKIMNEM